MASLSEPPADMPQEVIDFRSRSIMPERDVDDLWRRRRGLLEALLQGALADITARLRKRYATPFDPRPDVVVNWQIKIVTPEAYRARGYNPQDPTMEQAEKDRDRSYEQIKEAADSVDGLYDLPLKEDVDVSGITKGGPLGYSEASPYAWTDAQAAIVYGFMSSFDRYR
jgi:hypothetical protein